MTSDRRTFLKRSAAVVSGAIVAGHEAADARTSGDRVEGDVRPLDPELLRDVGEAVLPESLGPAGRERAVVAFEFWWADFEPDAELVHPYGGWVIPRGPPDREPEWAAQLRELEASATSRHGRPFGEISIAERREVLAGLIGADVDEFPPPARAGHVAVALMSHYFGSAEAVDRCYGVAIERLTCRTTATAGEIPPPLDAR